MGNKKKTQNCGSSFFFILFRVLSPFMVVELFPGHLDVFRGEEPRKVNPDYLVLTSFLIKIQAIVHS